MFIAYVKTHLQQERREAPGDIWHWACSAGNSVRTCSLPGWRSLATKTLAQNTAGWQKRKEEKKQLEAATNHSFTQATWMLVGAGGAPVAIWGSGRVPYRNLGRGPIFCPSKGGSCHQLLISQDTGDRIKREREKVKIKPTTWNFDSLENKQD